MAASLNATLSLGSLDVANDVHLTAIHEAGHCTAHWLMRSEVEYITAAATDERSGYVKTGAKPILGMEFARAAVAGPVAQAMATLAASPSRSTGFEDAWDDQMTFAVVTGGMGDVMSVADIVGSREVALDLFGAFETSVREVLTEFWPQLIALAETVVAHPALTLTGHEAFSVLNAALPEDHDLREL